MAKSTPKKSARKPNTGAVKVSQADGDTKEMALARNVLRPSIAGAVTIEQFAKQFGAIDLGVLVESLSTQAKSVNDGDLKRAEGMLIIQAHTLDAIFNNLAQKAARAEYMDKLDKYLRLALKAQSQCRATLQTLGELKNPQSVAFVKQANISNGPQQVNNGDSFATSTHAPAHAKEIKNQPNELLEKKPNEQLDTRAPGATGRADPAMATVGAIDGAADSRRKSRVVS